MANLDNRIHSLLDPKNCVLVLIDFQPQMAFAVKSIDGQQLINNAAGLAKAAKIFNVPTILTSVAAKSFSGPYFPQIKKVFPGQEIFDRTTMNCWEDKRVVDAIKKTGRKKIVFAGLWTEVCITTPAIMALEEGYEIYVVADACGGTTQTAHDMGILRMIQAGGGRITNLPILFLVRRAWWRR